MTERTGYEIGLGIELAEQIEMSTNVGRIDLDLVFAIRDGQYICLKFAAFPTVDNITSGVTGEALREVAIGELIADCARDHVAEETIRVTGRRIIDEAGGLTPEALEVVATAYRYGYALGDSPTRHVVDLLGLSRSKASRWIAEAREDGYLGETAERRPGGHRLAVEAARDRLSKIEQQLVVAEHRVEEYRKEFDEAEREAAHPLTSVGLGGREQAEALVRQRRERLDREYESVAILKQELKRAQQELAQHGQEVE